MSGFCVQRRIRPLPSVFVTRYNPRMAIAPERRDVLSRLGIFKAGAEDVFPRPLQSRPQLDGASMDDAAESFPTESTSSPVLARIVRGLQSRTAILLLIAVA